MTIPRFLQIHTLHSYPAALLNRDDSGLAKRMPFGDAVRTRISSQCLKRHWRDPKDKMRHEFALHRIPNAVAAVRSRNVVERRVMQPIREGNQYNDDVLNAVENALNGEIYAGPKAKDDAKRKAQSRDNRQPLLLGLPEVEYFREKAETICKEHAGDARAAEKAVKDLFSNNRGEGKNFWALLDSVRLPAGLEGALFGRMVTSDPYANIEAAIHVAHAFTVHREESESDYFSVVDDLQRDDEDTGAAHIGDMELTAGLFYGYVVVDVPCLVSNLEGEGWETADKSLAGQVVHNLIHLIATVSPGAKLGSTAPYAYADLMLIEAGSRQPRSLANAFRIPVKAQVESAAEALAAEMNGLDGMYGAKEARRISSKKDYNIPNAERLCLDDLATWAADAVRTGESG